jgi:GT2 family glycosyltransferase
MYNDVILGFSESHNLGLIAALGERLAFVDDDVVLDGDWIQTVEATFRIRLDATGITGPAYIPLGRNSCQIATKRI